MDAHNVVIIGAGFGGLTSALELAEKAKKSVSPIQITIIDKSDYQLFTPDLYEMASASRLIESTQELKDVVCIDVRLALRALGVRFVKAEVTNIDSKNKTVQTSDSKIHYDSLVFALGSISFDFGIPGIHEHAIGFKTIDEAIEIRKRIIAHLDSGIKTHVAVCGAGPAGVEVVAEMAVSYRAAIARGVLVLSLIDAGPRILGTFAPRVSEKAQKRLQKLGVQVKVNYRITKATEYSIEDDAGHEIDADIIVWTGGVTSNPLTKATGLQLNKRAQIIATEHLQSENDASVYAIGDSAQVPIGLIQHPEHYDQHIHDADLSEPVLEFAPQTAHEAVEQGKVAAHNIIASANDQKLKSYRALWYIYVITLGGKNGLLILPKGLVVGGLIAWFVRKFIDFRHFNAIMPFMHACSFWYNGIKTTLKND